jgi:hypothetical protein
VAGLLAVRHPNVVSRKGVRGFVSVKSSLERFLEKCIFDPTTGCVLWVGGTTAGRGKSALYGSFKDEGRRWFAHRWSAAKIHGQDIEGRQVDHCCDLHRAGPIPLLPNTLCVRHVQAIPGSENRDLQTERQTWVLTQKGLYEPPPLFAELYAPPEHKALPLHEPPEWWPVDKPVNSRDDDCPF